MATLHAFRLLHKMQKGSRGSQPQARTSPSGTPDLLDDEADRAGSVALAHRGGDKMNEQLTVTDLYERYSTALKWRLVRQLHNVADAEDVLQEVFVRVTRYWPTLPDKRYPWPWLTTVARSVMIDSGRTRAARQMHTISLEYEHARE